MLVYLLVNIKSYTFDITKLVNNANINISIRYS